MGKALSGELSCMRERRRGGGGVGQVLFSNFFIRNWRKCLDCNTRIDYMDIQDISYLFSYKTAFPFHLQNNLTI